jgi:hypothetical protein
LHLYLYLHRSRQLISVVVVPTNQTPAAKTTNNHAIQHLLSCNIFFLLSGFSTRMYRHH